MQCFYENELFKNKSRRQIKSFSVQQFFKNAAEVWASSPHLRSKSRLYHKIKQKSKKQSKESQLPSKSEGCNERYGFRGNCDSQGKLGMCPSLAEPISSGFSKSHVSHETIRNPLQLFPRNSCNGNALQKILLLGKAIFSIRQKGVPPLLLPASVLQLPRCLV